MKSIKEIIRKQKSELKKLHGARLHLNLIIIALFFLFASNPAVNPCLWAGDADSEKEMCFIEEINQTSEAEMTSSNFVSFSGGYYSGYPNPANDYCLTLGYRLEAGEKEDGGKYSMCLFPDGSSCEAWSFFEGKCGGRYSYCAKNGYNQKTNTDGKNPFSPHYAVCVLGLNEIGQVTELAGLSRKYNRAAYPFQEIPISRATPPEDTVFAPALLPSSFDWRNYNGKDWMTPVKDQSVCGACWAFSAVGATEAAYKVITKDPNLDLDLSEEHLNSDCLLNNNCCGGWHGTALEFIRDNGITDEACLPWDLSYYNTGNCDCPDKSCPSTCANSSGSSICSHNDCDDRCIDWKDRLITIDDYFYVPADIVQIKQKLIDKGPLSVALSMNGTWDENNVYHCDQDAPVNHAVVLAGYDENGMYWWVKNSWGADWGPYMNGYFKVGYGECAIQTAVYYVNIVDDFDHDGYSVIDGDCNDNDSSIYPGAAEICDGKDNNCDGTVDNKDSDGDGYIDEKCNNGKDCNDNDPSIHPGQIEICDSIDNDCNDVTDDVCKHFDANDDTFIDGIELAWICRAFGYSSSNPEQEWWYPVDYNKDGSIDGDDLSIISVPGVWGKTTKTCNYKCP